MTDRTCPSVESDRLLKIKDVAETLGISERKIWQLRSQGILPAVRIGNATRFRSSDVQRIVKEGAK